MLVTLLGIHGSQSRTASAQTRYNPFTGDLDYVQDFTAYEYHAEYTGNQATYEGWTPWVGAATSTASSVWRIGKNTYDENDNKTYTEWAGTGDFAYAWDSRSGYFADSFLLLSDGTSFILLSDGTSKILIRN